VKCFLEASAESPLSFRPGSAGRSMRRVCSAHCLGRFSIIEGRSPQARSPLKKAVNYTRYDHTLPLANILHRVFRIELFSSYDYRYRYMLEGWTKSGMRWEATSGLRVTRRCRRVLTCFMCKVRAAASHGANPGHNCASKSCRLGGPGGSAPSAWLPSLRAALGTSSMADP